MASQQSLMASRTSSGVSSIRPISPFRLGATTFPVPMFLRTLPPFGWWSRAQPCCGAGAGAQARAAKPQVSERALAERHAYLAFFDTSKLLCPYLDHGSSPAYWCVLPLLVRKVGPPSLRFHTSRRRRAGVL